MIYLDTSVLVANLSREPLAEKIDEWLRTQPAGNLFISEWVVAEFSAALSVKLRTKRIEPDQRADILSTFNRMCASSIIILPFANTHFLTAARLADQSSLGLRAGDALHLAICAAAGATLCTLDRRLAEAGPALGVKTLLL